MDSLFHVGHSAQREELCFVSSKPRAEQWLQLKRRPARSAAVPDNNDLVTLTSADERREPNVPFSLRSAEGGRSQASVIGTLSVF